MKSSGKNKSATKSSATIGDFFPLKKSTTKNKRNKDEQERSGKKIEEERKRVENMSNMHEGFSLDLDRCARVGVRW